MHLFQALSLNAKLVLPMHFTQLWSQITGVKADDESGVNLLLPYEKNVPLLLKDVPAILLHFLYALPFNIDKGFLLIFCHHLYQLNCAFDSLYSLLHLNNASTSESQLCAGSCVHYISNVARTAN